MRSDTSNIAIPRRSSTKFTSSNYSQEKEMIVSLNASGVVAAYKFVYCEFCNLELCQITSASVQCKLMVGHVCNTRCHT